LKGFPIMQEPKQPLQYSSRFYTDHAQGSHESALRVLRPLVDVLSIRSMVDYGCGGHGSWLRAAKILGVHDLHGFDGAWATPDAAGGIYQFASFDPEAGGIPHRPADLAISLEVAEHLSPAGAARLVDALCASSDLVLFGAALPGQGGTGHINEQLPTHWRSLFEDRGYECLDLIRPLLWNDTQVEPWYRQNTMLFLKTSTQDAAGKRSLLREKLMAPAPFDLVHPDMLAMRVGQYEAQLHPFWHPSFRNCLGMLRRWASGAARGG
jgi:hypothetical protein